jgi:hypothetical protein
MFKNKYITIIALVLCGVTGYFICNLGIFSSVANKSCASKLTFLKPTIDCESIDEKTEKLSTLQDKAEVMINGYVKTKKVKRASLFVRDLKTSRFAGVNDTDTYYMASLLKTPLLIGGYKLAEVEPKILDQEVVYTGSPNFYNDQIIQVSDKMIVGQSYKIKDLLRRSVVYSDNSAAQMLFDYYPEEYMDRILQALGIQITRPTGEVENFVTARSYANVFRILYNASFLNKEYSNEALSILSKTEFSNGATAKLPKDTLVAHKFAERTLVYPDNTVAVKQFHECGIVYADKGEDPYIFCIMTEGDDYKTLESVIADISLFVFEEITN